MWTNRNSGAPSLLMNVYILDKQVNFIENVYRLFADQYTNRSAAVIFTSTVARLTCACLM
ncbi:hypothetical protein ccbrp13_03080 [Ktedonobacteria bacterium brp13]|nr:hypothetical protein ccbrp13_03080 [Ktedonobacteria bacterium brp13]